MTQSVDSTTGASDAIEQPTQAQGVQQVQPNSPDVEAIVSKVADRLFPEFEKKSQSIKDRRIAELMKGMDELKQLIAGEGSKPEPAPTPQGTATATAQNAQVQAKPEGKPVEFDEAEAVILKQLGLSQDDAAVAAAKALDPVQRVLEYAKIVERRNEIPNPAAAVSLGGGAPADKEALAAKLVALQESDPYDRSGQQAALQKQLGWA